jgi:hypothetical protein
MALSKITTESLLDGEITAAKFATGVGGKVVQVVNTQTGAMSTGTTTGVHDDSIPTSSELNEVMTLAVTPTNSSNKLKIDVVALISSGTANTYFIGALFQDSTSAALAVIEEYNKDATAEGHLNFTHYMAAGTTSATTFKVRIGTAKAGTTTFNGDAGARKFGGAFASSITITEISV